MMENEVKNCVEILKNGGIILYPTDTIWGIGCDATNENAVKKIYELKKIFSIWDCIFSRCGPSVFSGAS